jgi:hypothetical protein
MITNTTELSPLQRTALREASIHPKEPFVRGRGGFRLRGAESRIGTPALFTRRLMNMLERDGLIAFDDTDCPTRAKLTATGAQLAKQLRDADLGIEAVLPRKAVRE